MADAAVAQRRFSIRCGLHRDPQTHETHRGVAVVSDDARFDLRPLRITIGTEELRIRLHAAWNARHSGATDLGQIMERLSRYIIDRYGETARPGDSR